VKRPRRPKKQKRETTASKSWMRPLNVDNAVTHHSGGHKNVIMSILG